MRLSLNFLKGTKWIMNDYDSAGHGLDSGFVLKEIWLVNSITDIKYSETQPIIKP